MAEGIKLRSLIALSDPDSLADPQVGAGGSKKRLHQGAEIAGRHLAGNICTDRIHMILFDLDTLQDL